LAAVTSVTDVTGFTQADAKNQDNLKINETDSANPKNTPKNGDLNPQKLVTLGTLVTLIAFSITVMPMHASPMAPFK